MKISFIIPAYNEENYIGQCLESIIQEAKNSPLETEIIVVNNASTDNTRQVAQSFTGVKVVDESRKGVGFARQAGFLASSGDLVAYIDADSQLIPGWIKTATKKIGKKNVVAVSGPAIFHDLPVTANITIRTIYYLAYCLKSFAIGANLIIKRAALQEIGGINTSFEFYGDDADLGRSLAKVGRVVFTFALPVYTSGRRFKEEGLLTMGVKYQVNYIWSLLFKKPFTAKHIDVREPEQGQNTANTDIKKLNRFLLGAKAAIAVLLLAYLLHSPTGTAMAAKADTKMGRAFYSARTDVKKFHLRHRSRTA
jgi:glycosyltransferase involved in cell wall biosynthesis